VSAVAELAAQLVSIESINPDVVAGGSGEKAVARFVAEWCERAELETAISEPAPGRPNVVATARGSGGGRTLMLNAHTDTVGVAGMSDPFAPRIEGGRLYGRGSYDMKGSLAACMLAAAEAKRRRLRGDVVLTAVSDEEFASVGTQAIADTVRADAAIVTEPTEMRLMIAHGGFVALEIETTGRAAHGSRPHLGIDAIAKMGHVLVGIEELDGRLRANPTHPYMGSGSIHASIIEGGQEYSSIPARCVLQAERRTIVSADSEIAAAVRSAATAVLGAPPDVVGETFWADSALLAAAGIPTVLFGPIGEGAHAEVEWVDVASLEQCIEIYISVAAELCA
jgi:acetylornithine deacetylase